MDTVTLSEILASFNFVGYTGSQGANGFTGSIGTGFTGSRGEVGFVGSQGDIGFAGSAGLNGFTGSIGIGFTGSAGFTGSVGGSVTTANNGATLSGTIAPAAGTATQFNIIGITGAITIDTPTGTPVDGQRLLIRIKDDGTARGITWTTGISGSYRAVATTLPTTTTSGKVTYVGCVYNTQDSRWDVIAVGTEA